MSISLRKDILRAGSDDKDIAKKATHRVVKEVRKDVTQRYLMGTSQAVDIINGGVKGTHPLSNIQLQYHISHLFLVLYGVNGLY